MTDPRPLHEELPDVARALQALPRRALEPAHEQRLWRGALARRSSDRGALSPKQWVPAFLAAAVFAGVVVTWLWPREAFVPVGTAQLDRAAPGGPLVLAGTVRGVPHRGGARLATPHASVAWTDARFLLVVAEGATALSVERGEVIWRAGAAERRVTAGQAVRTEAPVVLPEGFGQPRLAASPACDGRRDCLEGLAEGSDLAAQNALFELGRWDEYLRRFPDGVLAPEASIALVSEHVRAGRYREALAATRAHLERFQDDAYSSGLRTLRAELERRTAEQGTEP